MRNGAGAGLNQRLEIPGWNPRLYPDVNTLRWNDFEEFAA